MRTPRPSHQRLVRSQSSSPSTSRIIILDLLGHILVTAVYLIDVFELFDGFLPLAHLFEDATERIDQFFLLVVEDLLFLERILQFPGREIIHAAARKTLREIDHRLNPPVGIVERLLKFLNRLADLARLKQVLA